MKIVSKCSDFKGFFKWLFPAFLILIAYTDTEIILTNKYETTGNRGYLILALFITVLFWWIFY